MSARAALLRYRARWCVGVGVVLMAAAASAQPAYEVQRWKVTDGLPDLTVTAIARDSSGYLWIGTEAGLARFDGYRMESFAVQPGTEGALQDGYVRALLPLPQGGMLVGTSMGGIQRYDPDQGRFVHVPTRAAENAAAKAKPALVFAFASSPDGVLYAGTEDAVWRMGAPAKQVARHHGGRAYGFQALAWHEGALWAADETRIVRVEKRGTVEEMPSMSSEVTQLLVDRRGRLVAGGAGGAHAWIPSSQTWKPICEVPGATRAMALDARGRLWVGTDKGLWRCEENQAPTNLTSYLPYPFVRSLYFGAEGVMWVGTFLGGLVAFPERTAPLPLEHITSIDGKRFASGVKSFYRDDCGTLWIGTFRDGLLWEARNPTPDCPAPAPVPRSLRGGSVYSIAPSHKGGIWLARYEEGLVHYSPATGRVETAALFGMPSDLFPRDVLVDQRGRLWIADATNGLYRYDPGNGSVRHWSPEPDAPNRFPFPYAWSLSERPGGGLFIATTGGGLVYYDEARDAFEQFAPVGTTVRLPGSRVLSVALGPDDAVWAGLFGQGLVRLDSARRVVEHYRVSEFIPNGIVSNVHVDGSGRVFLTTQAGLSMIEVHTATTVTFGERDGMSPLPALIDALWAEPDGTLLVGTTDGYVRFKPEAIALGDAPPRVRMTGILEGGEPVSRANLRLPYNHAPVTFAFSSMPVPYPDDIEYQTRIEGIQHQWQATRGPEATYQRLGPGSYVLEVRAAQRGSLVFSEVLRQPFVVTPPFWKRWWFRGLLMLLIGAVALTLHRARVQQLLRMERLRTRIAGDLHDEIGADVSALALRAEAASVRSALDEQTRTAFENLSGSARETAQRVREVVWVLNAQYDTLDKLVSKLEDTAAALLAGTLPYRFDRPDVLPPIRIGMEARQHMYFLFKEAIRNAAEHGHARRIDIRVGYEKGSLTFCVTDDGVGFDVVNGRQGNGLRLMRERAEKAGGTLYVESAPGAGTTVRFETRLQR